MWIKLSFPAVSLMLYSKCVKSKEVLTEKASKGSLVLPYILAIKSRGDYLQALMTKADSFIGQYRYINIDK